MADRRANIQIMPRRVGTRNFEGQTIGAWIVGPFYGYAQANTRREVPYWNCRCDCGRWAVVKGYSLQAGTSTRCRQCSVDGRTLPPGEEAAFGRLLQSYRQSAARHGREFLLTPQQARAMFVASCDYCGTPPANVWRAGRSIFVYNGIDRVVNELHYLPTNCVPCCVDCNLAKRDRTRREFIDHSARVVDHQRQQEGAPVA